ncbi:DsbA family protein, partial [Alistipes putredinis]|nr:DsbA family protein [Alistipes putredinis]
MDKKRVVKLVLFIAFIAICISSYSIYSKGKETIDTKYGLAYGDPNAKIKMVEYMSFQCIDCYELHENIGDTLRDKIKNGEIY